MSASYFRTLIAYNRWAWGKVLDKVGELSDEEYASRQFNFGSVRSTLLHISRTEATYLARLKGEGRVPDRTEDEYPTFAALRAVWEQQFEEQQAFAATLTDDHVGQDFTYAGTSGRATTLRRDLFLAQLINHSTQHRSEAAVAVTEFGRSPGDIDVSFFVGENGPIP